MITAAWTKWLDPSQDVCKIWARDAKNRPIIGSYSIRSYDEKITVNVVSKYDIYPNFCSRNSGMQGTRAIEKTRGASSLTRGLKIDQRVKFSLDLFVETMNLINSLSAQQAKAAFQYYIEKGFKIQQKRHAAREKLTAAARSSTKDPIGLMLRACDEIADPQFVKAAVATALQIWSKIAPALEGGILCGVDGMMTGADARSGEPGDLWIERAKSVELGCEVKDKTKTFGFEILRAVEERKELNPSMHTYFLVSAGNVVVPHTVCCDSVWGRQIENLRVRGLAVVPITLRDLLVLAESSVKTNSSIIKMMSENLIGSPGLKNDTLDSWTALIS